MYNNPSHKFKCMFHCHNTRNYCNNFSYYHTHISSSSALYSYLNRYNHQEFLVCIAMVRNIRYMYLSLCKSYSGADCIISIIVMSLRSNILCHSKLDIGYYLYTWLLGTSITLMILLGQN